MEIKSLHLEQWVGLQRYSASWFQFQAEEILKLKSDTIDVQALASFLQDQVLLKRMEIESILKDYLFSVLQAALNTPGISYEADILATNRAKYFIEIAVAQDSRLHQWFNNPENEDIVKNNLNGLNNLVQVVWRKILDQFFNKTRLCSMKYCPWTFEDLLHIKHPGILKDELVKFYLQ